MPAYGNKGRKGYALSPDRAGDYLTAGKALLTVESKKTGQYFTYRVNKKVTEDNRILYFVSGSVGYLGTIFPDTGFRVTKNSKLTETAPEVQAFRWFLRNSERGTLKDCNIYHHGLCLCCGKELTTPESIQIGIGPVCARRN